MIGPHLRVALPRGAQPRAREAVPERAVGRRQHRVRRHAEQVVTKHPGARSRGARDAGDGARCVEHLAATKLVEPAVEHALLAHGLAHPRGPVPKQRRHAVAREALPKHARGTEHPPGLGLHRLDARLNRRHQRSRQHLVARQTRAQQLLQKKRRPLGARHGLVHPPIGRRVAQHRATELHRGLAGQRPHLDLLRTDGVPQPRQGVVQRVAAHGEGHPRSVGVSSQRLGHEAHRHRVAPMRVVKHQQERPRRRDRAHQRLPCGQERVAHPLRVAARGLQRGQRRGVPRYPRQLAHPREGLFALHRAQHRGEHGTKTGPQLLPRVGEVAHAPDACGLAQHRRQQAEGRARAHRVGPYGPHGERVAVLRPRALHKLPREPRLAHPFGARHPRRRRRRLGHGLREQRVEGRKLAAPPHEGHRAAREHRRIDRVARHRALVYAQEKGPRGAVVDHEADAEERRRHRVEAHAHGPFGATAYSLYQRERTVDRLAHRPRPMNLRPPRHQHHGRGPGLREPEGATGRTLGPIPRRAVSGKHRERHGPELLKPCAVRRGHGLQRRGVGPRWRHHGAPIDGESLVRIVAQLGHRGGHHAHNPPLGVGERGGSY